MSSEIVSTNPVVRAVLDGSAPRAAQLAASRGALPLSQSDLLEILVAMHDGDDTELRDNARTALRSQQAGDIEAALRSAEIAPSVLGYFATQSELPVGVHEAVVTNVRTPPSSIATLARSARNGSLLELISFNQQLLIQNPAIIDAILANSNRTPEAERRAAETKREFFEKERGAQQIANELRARGNDAAAEFIEQSEFAGDLGGSGLTAEDAILLAQHVEVPDHETDDSWLGLEYIEEIYEETEAQRQAVVDKIIGDFRAEDEDELTTEKISMINRIMKMNMRDRMKLAMKGNREARNILIRDPNKIISTAVIQNPKITEQEVEKIANMRTVNADVLRMIAINRKWARNYKIVHTLCLNPRSPLANVMSFLPRLQMMDLKAIPSNKNVPEAVRKHALRLISARAGR